jgi:hypothetical protein
LSQKRRFFRKIFRRKYLKNQNIGPGFSPTGFTSTSRTRT